MKTVLSLAVLILLTTAAWPVTVSELKKDYPLSQADVQDLVENLVISDRLSELERLAMVYRRNFKNTDLEKAVFDAAVRYYNKKYTMLALRIFQKSYNSFNQHPYREQSGYYLAKIYYQMNNRESALYYINRVLEKVSGDTNNRELNQESQRLKRRIRWDYISRVEGLPDDSISDIEFDGDDVWISMWTGGVARFTRSSRSLNIFNIKNSGLLSMHMRDSEVYAGRVWLGTYDGLCVYSKRSGLWDRVDNLGGVSVKKIKLVNGILHAATLGRGLYAYNSGADTWGRVFHNAEQVTDFLYWNNRLIVATLDSGVYITDNGGFKELVRGVSVKCLAMHQGRLYAGTHGDGIYVIDPVTEKYELITTKQGLSSDYVETIEILDGLLLAGTLGGGVSIIDTASGKIRRLTILDGLPSNDVVRITLEKNRIWFGTLSGGIGILLSENWKDL